MKGDAKVIEYLNKGLRSELTAVSQYWLHYRLLDNWGYKDLAKRWRKESIEEMQHADKFTTRIIFLEGFPNMQVLDPLRIGQTIKEVLDADLAARFGAQHGLAARIEGQVGNAGVFAELAQGEFRAVHRVIPLPRRWRCPGRPAVR